MLSAQSMKNGPDRLITPAERAEAAIIALLTGAPHLEQRHPINLGVQLMIRHRGDWKKVLNDKLFLAFDHAECLSILPLAVGEGIRTGGDNRRMKELFAELDPENSCTEECRAFSYMSALMLGYLVQRPYYQSERRETESWLLNATLTQLPDIGELPRHAALHQFYPFLSAPDTYPGAYDDPLATLVFSTMVAAQTARLREEWQKNSDFEGLRHVATSFVASCSRF